ncbi:hypothetical protein BGX27_009936 [Mortierella sp. AM989]|nr:hypothetical protein BGX27_009936 [Mortierella sp. AM989]
MEHNPLHIVEIIERISEYLTLSDRASCLLVSRAFYAALVSQVWRTINLTRHHSAKGRLSFPTGATLQHHKIHIRELCFRGAYPPEYLPLLDCPKLQALLMHRTSDDPFGTNLNQNLIGFLTLVRTYSSVLRNVTLYLNTEDFIPSEDLWTALAQCPHLYELNLRGFKVPYAIIPQFLQACSRPEVLNIESIFMPRDSFTSSFPDGTDKDLVITGGPRELTMIGYSDKFPRISAEGQSTMIRKFRNLESLYWRGAEGAASLHSTLQKQSLRDIHDHRFLAALSKDPWPLHALHSLDFSDGSMEDEDLAALLNQIHRLKTLKATRTRFGQSCLQALTTKRIICGENGDTKRYGDQRLRRHCDSIETLLVNYCIGVTGTMIQQLLECCPKLINLAAGRITVAEIAAGHLWVCREMRRLEIDLDAGDGGKYFTDDHNQGTSEFSESQRCVYSRLNTLTKLQKLVLSQYSGRKRGEALDLRLKAGLDLLTDLKDLRELSFDTLVPQMMDIEEASWVIENWPRIECMKGFRTSNKEVCELMKAIINPANLITLGQVYCREKIQRLK